MAKQILTGLDLLALPSLTTPKTGSVGFGAKSDGLYQKISTVESKLSTTAELLDRVKTAVPTNAKFTDTTYGVATTSANGLMSSADKTKLNGIAANANNYSLPTASDTVLGGVKIGSNISISSGVISVAAPYTHPATHPASMITGLHTSATTGVAGSVAWGNVTGKPSTFAPSSHSHSWSQITSKPSTFAPSAHNHENIVNWSNTQTTDQTYGQLPNGVSVAFTSNTGGYGSYGSVLNVKAYPSSGGGTLQLYIPYSDQYGGTGLKYRKFNYGGDWGSLNTIWDSNNLTKVSQLSNDSGYITASASITGNAATATRLATARSINGTSFDGSEAITTAIWGTARTLSFTGDVTGSSSVNGSANVATAMTLANSGVTAGTYRSVTVDAKGRVTAGTNPTTVVGYGLTDAVTTNTTQSITGTKTFTKRIGANLGIKIGTHSTDGLIEWDATNNAFKFNGSLYATGGVSAFGLGDGGSSGGGSIDMLDSWANYAPAKANYYVPASLLVPFRNDTLGRLTSLENGSATSVVTTGSGNAITSLTKSGSVITANKGSTFALASHTHTIAQITGLQGVLALKANHGYESNPKTLKQVDDSVSQLAGILSGYWVHRTTGVKTYFGLDDPSIVNGIMSTPSWAYDCSEVKIPLGVTGLGDDCFYGCYALTSITIPVGVTSIGDMCFSMCESLTSITIPVGVTSIGDYCFDWCMSLTSIILPVGLTSLGNYCFSYCYALSSITLPVGLTSLGDYCFTACESLTSITLPESITSIGAYCFEECYALTLATVLPAIPPTLGNSVFDYVGEPFNIKVQSPYVNAYKAATNWINYASIISAI